MIIIAEERMNELWEAIDECEDEVQFDVVMDLIRAVDNYGYDEHDQKGCIVYVSHNDMETLRRRWSANRFWNDRREWRRFYGRMLQRHIRDGVRAILTPIAEILPQKKK